ncbi:MAG: hypothetical protein AAFU85_00785 [Planctomycetota bacterium]
MSEHVDHRTLRLERLETRALLAADGFGEFTESDPQVKHHHGERPGEFDRNDQSESRDGDRGRGKDVFESRRLAKRFFDMHQRGGRGRVELNLRAQWHPNEGANAMSVSDPTQSREMMTTLSATSTPEGEHSAEPVFVSRTTTPIPNEATPASIVIRIPFDTPATTEPLPETAPRVATPADPPADPPGDPQRIERPPVLSSILASGSSVSLTPSETNAQPQVDEAPVASGVSDVDSRPGVDAAPPDSATESNGWIENIGFPGGLNDLDPAHSSAQESSPLALRASARAISESLPVVRDVALEALLVGPDAMIDLSETVVEFTRPVTSGGLIDFGLRATMGVHRSLDLITEDPFFDETDLRDLVLAALSEEFDESLPLFDREFFQLPQVDYAGATLLTAGIVSATHRRRKSDSRLLRTRKRS